MQFGVSLAALSLQLWHACVDNHAWKTNTLLVRCFIHVA